MRIEKWTGPPVDTHTYLVIDEPTREAWAIDAPLETAQPLLEWAWGQDLNVSRLILTHGHFDHMLDAGVYRQAGIPVAVHPLEQELLSAPQTALFGLPYAMPEVQIDEPLAEGGTLRLGGTEWSVWHVPGHSPGHVMLYSPAEKSILGGDLLFRDGYGRVDLPGSSPARMRESLRRLLTLPPETRVYPGHGPDTTLARERSWLERLLDSEAAL
ncbi:MAG TPA: MBL fold metallo-hydrolase [Armatimonadota bacterium]|nr:MBL fold metallo-hydrolase [Armatimonadota bacterium]